MNNPIWTIAKDQWLSKQLKTDAYSVSVNGNVTADDAIDPGALKTILKTSPVFAYAKCPVSRTREVALLEKTGFSLIDTNLTWQKKISRKKILSATVNIRTAVDSDRKEVTALARRNFLYSRFHRDPSIGTKTANAIKAAWAGSFFLGKRGDLMIVSQYEKTIIGFLQLMIDAHSKTLTIDLVAVDKSVQGTGIATSMISFAENYAQYLKKIVVGTQLVNLPSLKLYQSMGFKIESASYVFHYHH